MSSALGLVICRLVLRNENVGRLKCEIADNVDIAQEIDNDRGFTVTRHHSSRIRNRDTFPPPCVSTDFHSAPCVCVHCVTLCVCVSTDFKGE